MSPHPRVEAAGVHHKEPSAKHGVHGGHAAQCVAGGGERREAAAQRLDRHEAGQEAHHDVAVARRAARAHAVDGVCGAAGNGGIAGAARDLIGKGGEE